MPAASINNLIGTRFIELLSTGSTNNYAMQQVQNGVAKGGEVYFAFEQTAGKGQFQRQWLSSKGENIIFSAVMNTSAFALHKQFLLSMITALSIAELFNNYTTEIIKIKWANDIYLNDRKAAGILIENVIRGKNWQFAIIGIGININQTNFSDDLKNPVSLKQVTGKSYNVVELAKELCSILNKNVVNLSAENDAAVLEDYNMQLYKLNETASFKHDSKIFQALIKRVDAMGNLVLKIGNEEKSFATGLIEWIMFK